MSQPSDSLLVNDIHSQLNATTVARIEQPASVDEIREAVRRAAQAQTAISICGGRHAMGGQQFGAGTVLLDLSRQTRIHDRDAERGLVKAAAGIQWPELVEGLHALQKDRPTIWSIRQKQTGADRLSLGGALSANIHGRGLCRSPIIADVEAFTLMDAQGETRRCSRDENAGLFRLAIGGYGAFGIICDVTLRLTLRQKLERRVEIIGSEELMAAFDERIAAGYLYGDFQFSTDERSAEFLQRGVFSCYRAVEDDRPMPARQESIDTAAWEQLVYLAHTDRKQTYAAYCRYYLATDRQLYWSDTHQLSIYVDDYHSALDRRLDRSTPGS